MPRTRKVATPRSTLVLLVRHGHTPTTGKLLPGRAPGLHLSEKGIEQAAVVAERIATLRDVHAIYTSPLERTRETAAPIARARGLRAKADRGLLEADIGDWTGMELKTVSRKEEWKQVQRYPSGFRFPGGESFTEMLARAAGAVDRIQLDHRGQTVVVVSHADVIKAVVAHALGVHLDLMQRVSIAPCSVSAVAFSDLGPMVLTVGSTAALTDLGVS